MKSVEVRQYIPEDIEELSKIICEAWQYYVQEVDIPRIQELLRYYLDDDTTRIWIAKEEKQIIGMIQISLKESFRCNGEEGRLELLYIKDNVSNYYDIHTSLMNAVFDFLRSEKIEFLRIDTTLENADVLLV